jgi:NADH-quinone oxidoreductase subunit G
MPDLFIDGRAVHAEKGQTVLQAARAAGITIPTFCWHPQLSVAGNCRVCVVEVEGEGGAKGWCEIACNMPVTDGMRVLTNSPDVQQRRQQALQFLLLNHPVDCGICDKAGECLLQDQHYEYNGAPSISTVPKVRATKYVDLSQRIVLDNERCILCTRCVRFTREVSKSDALGVQHRGDGSLIRTTGTGALDGDAYSDNVVDICPVGALLSKSFLHQARVWYLKPTPSVCPGCARGCKVDLWTRRREWQLNAPYFEDETKENTRVVRVTPSAEQTGSATMPGPWICNWGRDLAQYLERPRATQAMRRGEVTALDAAIAAASALIQGARRPVALVSSAASNEELASFKAVLGARFASFVKADRMASPGEVVEDDLLICADKIPNTAGARALFGTAEPAFPGGCDLVLAWGEGVPWTRLPPGVPTILLGAYVAAENGHADVFIPISVQTERAGHYTNCDGELRAFQPCSRKPDGVIDAEALFAMLSQPQATALRQPSPEAAE